MRRIIRRAAGAARHPQAARSALGGAMGRGCQAGTAHAACTARGGPSTSKKRADCEQGRAKTAISCMPFRACRFVQPAAQSLALMRAARPVKRPSRMPGLRLPGPDTAKGDVPLPGPASKSAQAFKAQLQFLKQTLNRDLRRRQFLFVPCTTPDPLPEAGQRPRLASLGAQPAQGRAAKGARAGRARTWAQGDERRPGVLLRRCFTPPLRAARGASGGVEGVEGVEAVEAVEAVEVVEVVEVWMCGRRAKPLSRPGCRLLF